MLKVPARNKFCEGDGQLGALGCVRFLDSHCLISSLKMCMGDPLAWLDPQYTKKGVGPQPD